MDLISAHKYGDSNSKARQLAKQQQKNSMYGVPKETTKLCTSNAAQCYPLFFLLQSVVIKLKKETGRAN